MTINGTKEMLMWTGRHVTQKLKEDFWEGKVKGQPERQKIREIGRGSTKKIWLKMF